MNTDYPRMLFHRTKEPVTVQNRDEEAAFGKEWSRTIWPAAEAAEPDEAPIILEPEPEPAKPEKEPEEEVSPALPRRPAKPPIKHPVAKHAPKKR
jgi:hypothetical protein